MSDSINPVIRFEQNPITENHLTVAATEIYDGGEDTYDDGQLLVLNLKRSIAQSDSNKSRNRDTIIDELVEDCSEMKYRGTIVDTKGDFDSWGQLEDDVWGWFCHELESEQLRLGTPPEKMIPRSSLVKYAGSFGAPGMVSLNYAPDDKPKAPNPFGSTVNLTQPCIMLLVAKLGLASTLQDTTESILWMERFFVKTSTKHRIAADDSEPYRHIHNAELVDLNLRVRDVFVAQSRAKVRLIHGELSVREYLKEAKPNTRCTLFSLSSEPLYSQP